MLSGLLLKESLADESVLDIVQITKTETWKIENPADFQPDIWTAISFQGEANRADETAEKLSVAIKPRWYANLSTVEYLYVIFSGKVFKYRRGDGKARNAAIRHGQTEGIPDRQLDWGEE